jgi:hypothetical protein
VEAAAEEEVDLEEDAVAVVEEALEVVAEVVEEGLAVVEICPKDPLIMSLVSLSSWRKFE